MLLDRYRTQWPRIGAIIAMLVGGVTATAGKRLTRPQMLSAANLMALMAHQYEEYVDPGYFPGQFNRGLFKSDSPRNYALNPQTAMVINTGLAYPFYLAPVLFPRRGGLDWHQSWWAGARSCCTASSSHGRPGRSMAREFSPCCCCICPLVSVTSRPSARRGRSAEKIG